MSGSSDKRLVQNPGKGEGLNQGTWGSMRKLKHCIIHDGEVASVSSPLGGPGAARVAVWPGLLDFPWAIPFRVGSERERGKDIGI